MSGVRVGIVDDQALVRTGFRLVLSAEPGIEVVGEASDGREAIELVRTASPEVLLMDVRMPGMDGIEATAAISGRAGAPHILVLTTFDLDEYAFAAIRAGASGFLLKDVRPDELVAAIRTVHAGEAALSPRVTRRMLELFADRVPALPRDGGASGGSGASDGGGAPDVIAALTPREREILVAIGEGLNNTELAERFFLSESTVKTHVGRLLQKLDARDRVRLVIIAYEHGLLLADAGGSASGTPATGD
ncbi:response regulator transcription factor [Agromyces intestinalis]|uniref:Response regulator transcription factor n=1 Tax=Agromyces intestinalis TaxID=2592652 RepID=A0A5C1YJM5_9MICO|nr:response regulator transcription factor [Agromyces intestinalis]QEO15798.1 response regulator transcription factor [Agromyces intestinalis]